MVFLPDVSPPLASAVTPVGLDVVAEPAWPAGLGLAVAVVARPRSAAEGLAAWVEPTQLAPAETLATSALLASHWAALTPLAQTALQKH